MSLLPFDPLSPRVLSLVLLGLIVILTHAETPGARTSSLVSNNGATSTCGTASVPTANGGGWGCSTARNGIRAGNLSVGTSF